MHPSNSVQFDYLGTNTPGTQFFDIFDPFTFAILDSGVTQLADVPEPNMLLLLMTGLAGLFGISRKVSC